jgi:membrane fusion protein, macrolide-specific efflux system
MVLPRHRIRGLNPLNVSLVAVVLAIAVGAYFLFFQSNSQAASTTRPSVAVARGDVTASVSSSGTVESGQSASPQFETSGTVTAILVKVGQTVSKNAALARIDSTNAERQVRIAEQNQIAAANSVTDAEAKLTDAEDAAASPTPTPTTGQSQGQSQVVSVTSATASLAKARADKEQADQDLATANATVTATTLRAPIAGTITAINGSVGSNTGSSSSSGTGQTGTTGGATTGGSSGSSSSSSSSSSTSTTAATGGFMDIANMKAMQVVASFAEADAVKIKVKQAATVVLNADPNNNLAATLTSISPTPVTSNGVVSYSAYFALTKLPAGTRMGQTANVTVQTAKATNVLFVPSTAVTSTGGTYTVTLPNGGGTKQVQVGVRGDSFTQITSGLNEGDKVELIQGPIGGGTGAGGQGQGAGAGRPGQGPGGPGGGFPGGGGGGGGNRGN